MTVRLTVDTDKCIGSGMCEMLEEAVFLVDEDSNIAGVIGDQALPEERAATVIDRCPSGAIVRVEQPGEQVTDDGIPGTD